MSIGGGRAEGTRARVSFGKTEISVDLARPISLARPIDFSGREVRHFGAPAPESHPFAIPGFSGSVATGASCNCSTITLTPHCNGTHTECVGHLTQEPLSAYQVVPVGLVPALLLTVEPREAAVSGESTKPAPHQGDRLVTGGSLERAWPAVVPVTPRALVIRVKPADSAVAPYLSREAAVLLVERGIEHLIVNLPSIDRGEDEGQLTAHRVFFGLPAGSRSLVQAKRAQCTITELAWIADDATDGFYLLELQVPALGGDAVPSRPLLYGVQQ